MDDKHLEAIIGQLLRAGVLLAAAVVFAGGAAYVFQHHHERIHYRVFNPGGGLRTVGGIAQSALHLDSRGIIQLGLLLLIATPVARVVLAIAGFALERDHLYVVVSTIVLVVLIFSLMHAT